MLLDSLYPQLYLYQWGEKRTVDPRSGTTFYIPRWKKEANVPFANTEGTVIGTCPISAQYLSGTLKQFAGAHKHSDVVIQTALSSAIEGSVRELGKFMAKKIDTHIRDQVSAAGTFVGGSGVTASANIINTSVLKMSDTIKAEVTLDSNDNYKFPDGYYAGILHPKVSYDLKVQTSVGGWIDVHKYDDPETLYRGEIGRAYGIRWVSSTNVKRLLSGLSVASTSGYRNMVFAPGAYHVVELNGMNAKTYIKGLGSAGTADPVNQIATVGAKVFFQAVANTLDTRQIRLITGSTL